MCELYHMFKDPAFEHRTMESIWTQSKQSHSQTVAYLRLQMQGEDQKNRQTRTMTLFGNGRLRDVASICEFQSPQPVGFNIFSKEKARKLLKAS